MLRINEYKLACVDGSIPLGIESLSRLIHSVVSFPFFHMQTHSSGQSAAPTAETKINVAARCSAVRMVHGASKIKSKAQKMRNRKLESDKQLDISYALMCQKLNFIIKHN